MRIPFCIIAGTEEEATAFAALREIDDWFFPTEPEQMAGWLYEIPVRFAFVGTWNKNPIAITALEIMKGMMA